MPFLTGLQRQLWLVFVTTLLATSTTHAHSPLVSSAPSSGDLLEIAPAEISLVFKNSVSLVQIKVQGDRIKKTIRPASPHEAAAHSLPLPELSSGLFKIYWRAIGEDGHLMKGSIQFSVK